MFVCVRNSVTNTDRIVSMSYHLFLTTGEPSEDNCYADIEAVYDYLTLELELEPQNIILYGRSIGSGPSCHLAEKVSREHLEGTGLGGLILHSAFTSVFRIVADIGITILGDKFVNVEKMGSVR